jgi:hypothetical protein
MNIREISDIFKDTADNITAIKSYNFGWASDRVRQGNTEDFQELNEFPRVFFAVPTITGSDQTRKQDTYQVTLFFDDLLGYNNEGDEDPTLQIDKWANLQQYANYFVQRLNKIKQSILPNYLFIPEAPSITFDSFTGLQRMITVQLSFNLVVPTNCDPSIITLVQCIANIVTSSNLTASLMTVLKFAASLEGRATVTADINFVQKVASSLNANASLSGDISFVQKVQASLLATGTTTADLTVNAPSASLLLDLYPNAAVAYSLRKLRTAYTGSAVRVRASTSGAEGDVSFDVNNTISASSTVTVTAVGTSGLSIGQQVTFSTFWNAGGSNQNVFVTTWYDQSGNLQNATQTTQANQPQIVSSGVVELENGNPAILNTATKGFKTSVINFSSFNNLSFFTIQKTQTNTVQIILETSTNYNNNLGAIIGVQELMNYGLSIRGIIPDYIFNNYTPIVNSRTLYNMYYNNLTGVNMSEMYVNNIIRTEVNFLDSNIVNFTNQILSLFSRNGSSVGVIGSYQEFIFYGSDQLSNQSAINTNINTHYAIY